MTEEYDCPDCGTSYKSIGQHITGSSCELPDFTERQDDLIRGLLLGDGWINHQGYGNPYFAVAMKNYDFVEWFHEQLRPFTITGVKEAHGSKSTPEYYEVRTLSTEKLDPYVEEFYPGGDFQYKQVELNPTILKMWYVSDGSLTKKHRGNPIVEIGNQDGIQDGVGFTNMLASIGMEANISPSQIRLPVEDSKFFFDYIGRPPPGFEYKWPREHHYEDF